MVENEFEYMEFLVTEGLKKSSAYSYGRYLNAISFYLKIDINGSTARSVDKINSILYDFFAISCLAERYKNNCGTALRAYLRFLSSEQSEFSYPEEISESEDYFEGAKKRITVNAYERDKNARNKAIEAHGVNCKICNMHFEEIYGELGIGFIHVHHIKPLHTINETYKVNPEIDLIPVCPNCHAILHRSKNPISIDELKAVIKTQKARRMAKP
ncbi:HNH endonuclease [Methylomagnum ishizawai]|uniref:HNH endonuclease n=1 Tax=Methylomagnum ishizawai TaxID=1760988 RepID=UPI001C321A66|nr:HNH endonuclease [Methylomagnum ishizawai]BBL74327.1 hypothetical protein MishRS11D_14250 [Methylomagnum ishizawai]